MPSGKMSDTQFLIQKLLSVSAIVNVKCCKPSRVFSASITGDSQPRLTTSLLRTFTDIWPCITSQKIQNGDVANMKRYTHKLTL